MTQTMRSFDCSKLENGDTLKTVSKATNDSGTLLIFRRDVMLISLMLFFVALPFLDNIWYQLGTRLSLGWIYVIGVIAEVIRAFVSLYMAAVIFNMLWRIRNITPESKTTLSLSGMRIIAIIGFTFALASLVSNVYNHNAADTSITDLLLSSIIPFIGMLIFSMVVYASISSKISVTDPGITPQQIPVILAEVGNILTGRYSGEAPADVRTTIITSSSKEEEYLKALYVIEGDKFSIDPKELSIDIDADLIERILDLSEPVSPDSKYELLAKLKVRYSKSPRYETGDPFHITSGNITLDVGERHGSLLIIEEVED